MTSSNGNIFRVTGPLCGEFTGPGEFPAQRPVTRSFGILLICTRINGWLNNGEAGDLRRNHAQYDVTVMLWPWLLNWVLCHYDSRLPIKPNPCHRQVITSHDLARRLPWAESGIRYEKTKCSSMCNIYGNLQRGYTSPVEMVLVYRIMSFDISDKQTCSLSKHKTDIKHFEKGNKCIFYSRSPRRALHTQMIWPWKLPILS